jgi:hypothetical protein
MSYTTPVETTTSFKDLEVKLQSYSANIKAKLSWLTYAFGLADRVVELKDGRPKIYPVIYQDTNKKEMLSLMPSDLHQAYCFWVKEEEVTTEENNASRLKVNVSLIFYMDLRDIAPSENWKLTKTKIRQDILEAIRQTKYSGLGVLEPVSIIEDDITAIFDGYTLDQVDNKFKIYPKNALRVNFEFGYLRECGSFNTYS